MVTNTLSQKRIRFSVPSYKKVYSVYQYNRHKYSDIYKKIQALSFKYDNNIFNRVNPYRVLQLCYIKNAENKPKHLGDEKHIFRYKALDSVLKEIGDYLVIAYELENSDVLKYLFRKTHLILYTSKEFNQAELFETCSKPIGIRLKTHITLLRYIQKGYEIEEAIKLTREKHKIDLKVL